MAKSKLLYLCHRIPYPPNKGDKIRSFNILKALSQQFEIHLGCFIDDDFDYQYIDKLANWCVEYKTPHKSKLRATLKGMQAFFTNRPITLPYFYDRELQHWVFQTIEKHKIDKVFIFSSSMAQYVDHPEFSHLHRVIDFIDVDSDKWRQYAESKTGLMRWVYQREQRLLQKYEQRYCEQFQHSLLVSPDEAQLFRTLMPTALAAKIHPILNGVDTIFFDPAATIPPAEYRQQNPALVFTGAMDYWANVDAVIWFCQHVWPQIRAARPDAHFYIVGGNPSAEVQALHGKEQVWVTGRVDDIRSYLHQADVVVAPLRIARGIQNKVLEAMAMNRKIVASCMALEGINAPLSAWLSGTDEADEYARQCLRMLQQDNIANPSRSWVIEHFTWSATLNPLPGYLDDAKV